MGAGSKQSLNVKDAVIDFIGGTAGGVANVYVGQPLDTVKVKMQTFPTIYSKGMKHCFLETFRKDGIRRGLYAGTIPALAANMAENSILFTAYGQCQKLIALMSGTSVADLNPLSCAVAGFGAGFFGSLALCPTELVKCRLQAMREMAALSGSTANHAHVGPWNLVRTIIREEGFVGFFRGLTSTFAREMPGYFFFFGSYETLRALLAPKGGTKDDIGPVKTVFCGGTAGVILWTAIFPTDVVKSRIQVSNLKMPMITCMTQIVKTEGIRALYNGLGPTLVRTFPASGACFFAYEYSKRFLQSCFP